MDKTLNMYNYYFMTPRHTNLRHQHPGYPKHYGIMHLKFFTISLYSYPIVYFPTSAGNEIKDVGTTTFLMCWEKEYGEF